VKILKRRKYMVKKIAKKVRKRNVRKRLYVIGIDAGNEKSALVLFDPVRKRVLDKIYAKNDQCLTWLKQFDRRKCVLAIEQIKSYGNIMGDSLLETCVWNGRFWQAWGSSVVWIPRSTVKSMMCHNSRAKDSNVRQAVIDFFPPTGDGRTPQIGTKKNEGPLFGITGDLWSALAVAITADTKLQEL
jgi:hypothetical protein